MTAHEFALLALGLLLGVVAGAALVELLRRRPPSEREVRVTVTSDAVPRRRAATLADDPFAGSPRPARGGPADPWIAAAGSARSAHPRTPVRTGGSLTLAGAVMGGRGSGLVAVPMGTGVDPLIDVLRAARARRGFGTGGSLASVAPAATTARDGEGSVAIAVAAAVDGQDPEPTDGGGDATGAPTVEPVLPDPGETGPCADLRRVADERCEVATRARSEAERAHDTLRAAQRSYDDELVRAEEAARTADPRTVRAAKDTAQQTFRVARAHAATAEAVDAAARDWLLEINRINRETRAAVAEASQAQEAARALAGTLERLSVEADAARIAADAAEEACLGARQALADCEEAAETEPADADQPAVPSGAPAGPWADDSIAAAGTAQADDAPTALEAGTMPTVFRLLQGDHEALSHVVARLAGDDPEQRRHWQLQISDLVDAILATAIEGSALEFPEDHAFWGPFTLGQSRDIVGALASLGYRFDGLGGWQDGRIPSQRDLSLALGYAGLDPMRIRHWPNEAEMFELFSDIRVAAPEYLAVSAGDLTLGELVSMLGRRAEPLAEVWNAWGRIRPLLLEER